MSNSLPQRVLALLGDYPQGATVALLAERISADPLQLMTMIESLETEGKIEKWRFIPERYRLAACPEDDKVAAASVRLRRNAWPIMQALYADTALPVSLHQLVTGGHTVVERCPDGPQTAELALEAARYGKPASLAAGATSLAFMAFASPDVVSRCVPALSDGPEQSAYHDDMRLVRDKGFATSAGRRVRGAGAVTAPILSSGGQPLGALCVYGEISALTPEIMARIGPLIVLAASRLAIHCKMDEHSLLAPMRHLAA